MQVIKRTALLLIGLVLVLMLTLWGFIQNFPGESIADTASSHLSSQTGINFEIQGFELGWSKLSIPEISISTPNWLAGPVMRLLILKNVEAPFVPVISSGKAKINGELHEGTMQISAELMTPRKFNLSLEDVRIERVPLFALIPYTFVTGSLSMSVHISNFQELQQIGGFPKGRLRGNLKDTNIRLTGGSSLLDLQFPELNQTEILFDLELGPVISLTDVQLKGSLEGKVDGIIQLDKNRPNMSSIDLNFLLTPSPDFKNKLRRFSKILLSFQCGETINFNLKGTFSGLNLPTRNKC